jgi:MFS superfamily sulfate permease-like transporter
MSAAEPSQVERWVPGVRAIRTYQRAWLRPDLLAGVVLAAILVPQGMAYAQLAGLPAVTGLYTTIACLVGYAVFGPSRVLVLGPDSSISPLILAAITPLLAGGGSGTAIALAGMLGVLVGLTEIGLGLGKLGFVADLLSKEVQVGYMNGLGITIIVGQLPKLFGFSTHADSFLDELRAFVDGLDQTETTTLIVGIAVLVLLLGGVRGLRARRSRRGDCWRAAPGRSGSDPSLDERRRCPRAADRRDRHHAGVSHRHDRDRDQLRCPAR